MEAGKNERTVGVQEKSDYGSWWSQKAESSKKAIKQISLSEETSREVNFSIELAATLFRSGQHPSDSFHVFC